MHVPDGFLDAPTSIATATVAAGAVTVALRRAPRELDERTTPLAGLTAAYVFAAQMLNFPVGAGTSGHLLGGALAATLVGPYTATLVITVVLLVQALLFGDGGLTALGTNVVLLAVVGVWVGWGVVRGVLAVLPKRQSLIVPAAAVGGFVAVPAAALAFSALFAIGGTAPVSFQALATTMVGWHTVIGVGEAAITGLTVGAVVAVRPDLVYAVRSRQPELQPALRLGTHPHANAAPQPQRSRPTLPAGRLPVRLGVLVLLVLAGVVSFFASGHPDGLEYVAAVHGFLDEATTSVLGETPLADYGAETGIPVGVAGIAGVLVTIAVGYLVFRSMARRRRARTETSAPQRV
jgi:cobalt/nickel transport system permease protein